ncbi:MAG: tetratricopeptide repeat protein [bacterium]
MNNPPGGIVTFLFTDIEGSTKLAQDFPDKLQVTLERHYSILQDAFKSNNGFVFVISGDGFCCAFQNGDDAVKAAVDAQLNLSREKWDDAVIKIRIGIHSGNAEWNGKDYMGYITLARTARVMSAAYGEQVIISNNSYELVKEKFNITNNSDENEKGNSKDKEKGYEISFRDLGERRLKDLIQPIKLFQIISPGLKSDFPPLKTLDARPNNLPVQLTSFIGREKEIKEIKKVTAETRLLTLTGSGGTGKTRLSLQVGADIIDDFVNGVWFVELAGVQDPGILPQLIANIFGIKDQQGKSQEDNLIDYVKDKKMLIILDNCEHLISACAHLSEKLLQCSTGLKIIATSREALRCSGEKTHHVLPLNFPDPVENLSPENLTQYEAVRLFIERALAVNHKFQVNNENAPALAQICFHLDGIPLAIELAAARVKILSLEMIYEKLNDRFKLLTGGKRTALPRQQTLRALIDWSYDLLNEKEKILFQRLSVFAGGWTLEAAEDVCSDGILNIHEVIDLLTGLLDKSLIISIENSGSVRFSMLESLKQYAEEKLDDNNIIIRKHIDYFKGLADYQEMITSGREQLEWINMIDAERGNIRRTIFWAAEFYPDEVTDIIKDITEFWTIKGYFSEGLQICFSVLDKKLSVSELNMARILYSTGLMSNYLGKTSDAERYGKEALSIFRNINDGEGIVLCLNLLGATLNLSSPKTDLISDYYNEALMISRELNLKRDMAITQYNISFVHSRNGDYEAALNSRKEALAFFKELRNTYHITLTMASLGVLEFRKGNFESARSFTEESLSLSHQLGDKYLISINLTNLGCIYSGLKDFVKARTLIEEAIVILRACGYKANIVAALYYIGEVVTNLGDNEKSINFYKESIQTGYDMGIDFFMINNFYGLGVSCFNLKDFEKSVKYFSFMKNYSKNYNGYSDKVKMDGALDYMMNLKELLSAEIYEKSRDEALSLNKDEMISFALNRKSY